MQKQNESSSFDFFFFFRNIMILGHGANTMTMEEAKAKLCAQAKYVVIGSSKSTQSLKVILLRTACPYFRGPKYPKKLLAASPLNFLPIWLSFKPKKLLISLQVHNFLNIVFFLKCLMS